MSRLGVLALAVGLSACSSLRLARPPHIQTEGRFATAAPPSPICNTLADKTLAWNLTGIVAGALGSGAATGTGIFTDPAAVKYTLTGAASGFSLLGAVASYLGGWYAARYTKECK